MHRHAQEQLTCSQHLTVLPSLSDPTKQTCCPRSLAWTWIQALVSALIYGSTATGKPYARPKGVSHKQNVQMLREFSPRSFIFFPPMHTGSASFCDFLQWQSVHLPFFPFKCQLICFSFTVLHITLCMHVLWSFATCVLFFFHYFSASHLVIYIFNDTTERSCYTCLVKLWDLLFTSEIVHCKQN